VVDDLLPRLKADASGKPARDVALRERQLLINFLCASAGGPLMDVGRDMKTAHNYCSLPAVRFALDGRSALDRKPEGCDLPAILLLSAVFGRLRDRDCATRRNSKAVVRPSQGNRAMGAV
jgi:hypothetical protein